MKKKEVEEANICVKKSGVRKYPKQKTEEKKKPDEKRRNKNEKGWRNEWMKKKKKLKKQIYEQKIWGEKKEK